MKTRAGFSLFEVIVYLAIFGVVLVSILGVVAESISSRAKALALHTVTYQTQVALDRITSDVRAAVDIDETNLASSRLTLTMADGTSREYVVTAGALTITYDSETPIALTNDAVTVTNFSLANITPFGVEARDLTITIGLATITASNRPELAANFELTSAISSRL